jgi:hypothetical protein
METRPNAKNVCMSKKFQTVLSLDNQDARSYFFESENYCSIDLPEYIRFDKILSLVSERLEDSNIGSFFKEE